MKVAERTNNFDDIDKEYAHAVWVVEKEFNVGPVTEDFLALKFWNLFDDENTKRYNKHASGKGNDNTFGKTFGG